MLWTAQSIRAAHCRRCRLWVKSGLPAPCPFTSAFGGKADIIRRKADIPLPMSGVGGKADSLAHLSACLLIAISGPQQAYYKHIRSPKSSRIVCTVLPPSNAHVRISVHFHTGRIALANSLLAPKSKPALGDDRFDIRAALVARVRRHPGRVDSSSRRITTSRTRATPIKEASLCFFPFRRAKPSTQCRVRPPVGRREVGYCPN